MRWTSRMPPLLFQPPKRRKVQDRTRKYAPPLLTACEKSGYLTVAGIAQSVLLLNFEELEKVMSSFTYEAMDAHGKEVKAEISAESESDALEKIRALNLFPTKV